MVIRMIFPILEKISPRHAYSFFKRLFTTPYRFSEPKDEKSLRLKADTETIEVKGNSVTVYSWGSGKPVFLVHGWCGRATQFKDLISTLIQAGYQVIAFDAIAHGQSTGKRTHFGDVCLVVSYLSKKFGPFHAIVGHSIGGIAVGCLISRGLETKGVITFGSASKLLYAIEPTKKIFNYSADVNDRIVKWANEIADVDMNHCYFLDMDPKVKHLIVTDENDSRAPYEAVKEMHQKHPNSKMITTKGLGHVKILYDEDAIAQCIDFVESL